MSPKKKTPKKEAEPKKEIFRTLKGMRDLIDEKYYGYQGFFEKAAEVALYYGFKPIETPILEREEIFVRTVGEASDIVEKEMYRLKTVGGDRLVARPEGTAPVVRAYLENGLQAWPQPVMLYYAGPFFRHDRPQRGRYRELRQFGLEILGSDKAINDALTIKLTTTIIEEAGLHNLRVEISSIGDKECRPNFRRELANYYRRHTDKLCADCLRRLRDNPLRLLDCKNEGCQPIKEGAPDPVSFLCEACKRHFKEVLEYLESMNVSYFLNKTLVRGLDYYSRTVFEIFEEAPAGVTSAASSKQESGEEKKTLAPLAIASGGRYDYLARLLGSPRDIPGIGVGIGADRIIESPSYKALAPRLLKKPKIYFIQLGFNAKLRSFEVIEALRKDKIPILHSLSKDSLAVQLATAERLKIPYVIILGQKEVTDGTVIVREMDSHSQKTVRLEDLPDYLKKIK